MDRELRYRYAHGPSYRSLLSCAPTPLPGSAHAPPINSVGADCDSQPEQEIKKIPAQVCESRGSTATDKWTAPRSTYRAGLFKQRRGQVPRKALHLSTALKPTAILDLRRKYKAISFSALRFSRLNSPAR